MDRDETARAGDGGDGKAPRFGGEEHLARTSPGKDLVAVGLIAALSVFAMDAKQVVAASGV